MDLHRITRIASHVLGLAAAVLVAAGLFSYTFVATGGELIGIEKTRVRPVGAYITGRTVGSRRPATVEVIRPCYRYRVGDDAHESCRIGLGVSHLTLAPFGRRPWETLQANDEVRVYYARRFPGIAVLTRGPDWVVSLGLALAAVALRLLSRKFAVVEMPAGVEVDASRRARTRRARRRRRQRRAGSD